MMAEFFNLLNSYYIYYICSHTKCTMKILTSVYFLYMLLVFSVLMFTLVIESLTILFYKNFNAQHGLMGKTNFSLKSTKFGGDKVNNLEIKMF